MQALKISVIVMALAIVGIVVLIVVTLVQRTGSGSGDTTAFGEVPLPLADGCNFYGTRDESIQAVKGRLIVSVTGLGVKPCIQVLLLNSETGATIANVSVNNGCKVKVRGVTEQRLVLHFHGSESDGCRRSIVLIDLETGAELGSFRIPEDP